MRLVKVILFAALVAGWWQLWHVREDVTSAYTTERPELALELDGIGLMVAEGERPVSPYALTPAGSERAPTFPEITDPDDEASANDGAVDGDALDENAVDENGLDDGTVDPGNSIEVTGGEVELTGTVQLDDGTPVAGATVRIERFTSQGSGTAETVSGPDGSWSASGLLGGRLRVRAYAPNQLASLDPVVLVVTHTGSASVDLRVGQPSPDIEFEVVGPIGIALGTSQTVAVVVSREFVDELGRFVELPVINAATNVSVSGARLLSADTVTTDTGGAARYLVACDVDSSPLASIALGGAAAQVVDDAAAETDDAVSDEPTVATSATAVLTLPPCLSAEMLAELEAADNENASDEEGDVNEAGEATVEGVTE